MHIKMKGDDVSASAPNLEFMFSLKTKAGADFIMQMLHINARASFESVEEIWRGSKPSFSRAQLKRLVLVIYFTWR